MNCCGRKPPSSARAIGNSFIAEFSVLVVRPLYRRLIARIVALTGPSIAGLCTVLFAGAALAEVFVSDATVEISGTGPRTSRSCTIVLKPIMALGDAVAPRLAFV